MNPIKILSQANEAFRAHDYKIALNLYEQYSKLSHEHAKRIAINLQLVQARLREEIKLEEINQSFLPTVNEKVIIYTINIGGYESIKEPLVTDPTVEYFLFTDNEALTSENWTIIYIKDKLDDPRRTSRLPKILAHKYLPDHDISVYIDSSIEIKVQNVRKMIKECMDGRDIALYQHYKRDCVYDEINFVMNSKDRVISNQDLCKKAIKKYESINYPKNNGLFENAFIFRRNTSEIKKLNELWLTEYQAGTERDQFVFMYALTQLGIKPNVIKIGKGFRDNPFVNFYKHQYHPSSESRKQIKLSNIICSNLDERLNRIAGLIKRKSIKIVSFDIFDTLVFRKVFEPKDVFHLMSKNNLVKEVFTFYDFAEARIDAENVVRRSNDKKSDPTIDEIYNILSEKYILNDTLVKKLIDIELSIESSVIEKNESVKKLFDLAIECNKKVIIVSDMYLPFDFLEKTLKDQGFLGYHKFYLSADIGKTKKNGDIFPFICSDLHCEPSEILHLGDNLKSDIKMAELHGLKAMRILDVRKRFIESVSNGLKDCMPPYTNLNQIKFLSTRLNYGLLLRKSFTESLDDNISINSPERLGYSILGPFLLSLVLRIRRKCHQQGINKFLWLARDGYLPFHANKLIDSVLGNAFDSKYLPVSRKMLFPIYLQEKAGLDQVFKISYQNDFLVSNFITERFGSVGLDILRDNLGDKYDIILNQYMFEHHDFIKKLFVQNFEKIKSFNFSKAEHLDKYYRDTIFIDDEFGLFDVGRKGTFQKLFSRRYSKKISGFYVVNSEDIVKNVNNDFDVFLPMIDQFSNEINPDTIIYELLLSELKGSFLGFDGSNFIRANKKVNITEESFISKIQECALDFVKDSLAQYGKEISYMEQQPYYAAYAMENAHKNKAVKEQFSDVPHYDEMSTNKPRMLIDIFNKPKSLSQYFSFPVKSKRKRVIIYSPAITRIRGGAERVASRLANYLDNKGYDVLMVSSANPSASTIPVYELNPTVYVRNINVNDINTNVELIKYFETDFAAVLASGSVLINIAKSLVISNTPFMLSERAEPSASLETYWKGYNHNDYNDVYALADIISVQFDSFKEFFNKANKEKTVTLANPFDLPCINHEKPRRKVIVCAARVWFVQKRQDLLLKAFSKIAKEHLDWSLEFYGNAYGEDADILKSMAKEYKIEKQVKISPSVDNIADVFENSSVFVLPSKFEGFPNSLAEALSYGLPSIGFESCPGVNQLIENNTNGYLVPDRNEKEMVDSLSKKLSKLISGKELREEMSINAVGLMKRYCQSKVLEEWMQALSKLKN